MQSLSKVSSCPRCYHPEVSRALVPIAFRLSNGQLGYERVISCRECHYIWNVFDDDELTGWSVDELPPCPICDGVGKENSSEDCIGCLGTGVTLMMCRTK